MKTKALLAVLVGIVLQPLSSQAHRRVLVIGLDGTRGDVVHHVVWELGRAPNIKFLMQNGAYSPCANKTDLSCARAHSGKHLQEGKGANLQENTNAAQNYEWLTAPGWASVLTGADANLHAVANNNRGSLKLFSASTTLNPTFLMQAKRLGLKTAGAGVAAFLTSHYQEGSSRIGYGVLDYECGLSGADKPVIKPNDSQSCNLDSRLSLKGSDGARDAKLTSWLLDKITDESFDVIMGVYDQIDEAGHSYGFSKKAEKYIKAITVADQQIGQLINEISNRVSKSDEEWLVALTSDHGGHDTFFGGMHSDTIDEDEVVPFVLTTFGSVKIAALELKPPVRQMDTHTAVMTWIDKKFRLNNTYVLRPVNQLFEVLQ